MKPENPLRRILSQSRLVFSTSDIQQAIDTMAEQINRDWNGGELLMLCVMNGAIPTAAALMQRLNMPLQLDYIHASRYRDKLQGGKIKWLALPQSELAGKSILVVDDIFDQGDTLKAIADYCLTQGASQVKTAALINKQHDRKIDFAVDYQGLTVADDYVFGFGMDCESWGRNLDTVYAFKFQPNSKGE